jgi:hypothetical protein
MTDDFAVVTCFFSYVKNSYAVRGYKQFKDNLERQGVKLYTVELAFTDEDYLLKEDDVYLRLRTDTVLWHKERLLNILTQRLPPHVDKVAWLDCDVFVENDNWAEEVSYLLNEYKIVQLGREHLYLNTLGQVDRKHGTLGYGIHHRASDWNNYAVHHPGLGWAASRDLFFKHGGLFEYAISGGGDGIMGYIFANGTGEDFNDMKNWITDWKYKVYKEHCPTMINKIEDYKNKVAPYVNGSVTYLDSKVLHKYHAPQSRRGYLSRPNILKGIDFYKDLLKDDNGLFKWRDMRYNLVLEKFFSMKDDQSHLMRNISYEDVNIESIL